MTTIYDVSRLSGYSIATVSKVINNKPNVSEKAKVKVEEAIKELSYTPMQSARSLVTNKSQMIGVIFGDDLNLGLAHPFLGKVMEEFRKFIDLYNYDLLFVSRGINQGMYIQQLIKRGVDGIVVLSTNSSESSLPEINKINVPAVLIDYEAKNSRVVHSDNVKGAIEAVRYLYSLGHRRIAHIHSEPDNFIARQRIDGFNQGIENLSIKLPEEYLVNGGYFSREAARKAMIKLALLEEPPSAIFASSDVMAIGAMEAIKELGMKVPEDFSIIGFDNIELSSLIEPSLTTIAQDTSMLGRNAAKLLIDAINSNSYEPQTIVVPVELIIRNSTTKYKENSNEKF